MKLAPGLIRGTVGQILKDSSGNSQLTFTVKGPAASPSIKMDTKVIGQRAVETLGQQLLKGLKKNQPTPPPEETGTAPSNAAENPPQQAPPPDPGKELEKALKNIFK
jgi:hypothetical protein